MMCRYTKQALAACQCDQLYQSPFTKDTSCSTTSVMSRKCLAGADSEGHRQSHEAASSRHVFGASDRVMLTRWNRVRVAIEFERRETYPSCIRWDFRSRLCLTLFRLIKQANIEAHGTLNEGLEVSGRLEMSCLYSADLKPKAMMEEKVQERRWPCQCWPRPKWPRNAILALSTSRPHLAYRPALDTDWPYLT